MNPKFAWLELDRAEPPVRPAQARVTDFAEIYGCYDEATAREQASRCVQCVQPTCVAACPLQAPIPELMSLTAAGQFREAGELLLATHTFPELFAHICLGGQACESACLLSSRSEAVPVSSLARFLLNHAHKHGVAEPAPAVPNGQHVGIVGAGLCGLISADLLSVRGYAVVLLDTSPKPGGRIVNGLPGFKVDRSLIEHRVQVLRERGVVFRMGIKDGAGVSLRSVCQEFDALLLATGRTDPVPLDLPGADLKGVSQAYEFVLANSSPTALCPKSLPGVADRRVVVLGAGDTAMDALRVAIRCGAKDALCVCRRDRANMAAAPREVQLAEEEGARFLLLSEPVALLGKAGAEVTHVRCRRMQLSDSMVGPRPSVTPITGSDFDVPADVVLVAYGFRRPELPLSDFNDIGLSQAGFVRVFPNYMTSRDRVFAAGSIVRGPISLADIVREARAAVRSMDAYLAARRHSTAHVGMASGKAA